MKIPIKYKLKKDIGIEFVTSLHANTETAGSYLANIYKYKDTINDCDIYFDLPDYKKYIGYENDNFFYIVSLHDHFDKEMKDVFGGFIDFDDYSTFQKLHQMRDFHKFHIFPHHCTDILNLDIVRPILDKLNDILACTNLKIRINYLFQMENNSEVNAYSVSGRSLLLCIFDNNKCVSSLVVRFHKKKKEINIDSKTNKRYANNKLNKLLRAVIIIISTSLFPSAKYLVSVPINPTSLYLMIHYFNAIAYENDTQVHISTYKEMETYVDNAEIISKVELNNDNIENAENVFVKTVEQIKCKRVKTSVRSLKSPHSLTSASTKTKTKKNRSI